MVNTPQTWLICENTVERVNTNEEHFLRLHLKKICMVTTLQSWWKSENTIESIKYK